MNESLQVNEYKSRIESEINKYIRDTAQKGVGIVVAEKMSLFFEAPEFKNIGLDVLDILSPFSNSFFALRDAESATQIKADQMGSGVEFIFSLLLQQTLSDQNTENNIYIFDEPELHLHPTAQQKLGDLILRISEKSYVFVASHSPYLIERLFNSAKIGTLKDRSVHFSNKSNSLFAWGPTFSEINYRAFDLITAEFHNEIFGALMEKQGIETTKAFDKWLVSQGIPLSKKWAELKAGVSSMPYDTTLSTFVRHSIHHPENRLNGSYTPEELRSSCEEMMRFLP